MPHIVIEYSRELESSVAVSTLMQTAFDAAVAAAIMKPEDIKIRALPYTHFRLEGGAKSFVHVTCRLLAGRTTEQKVGLSTRLRERMATLLPGVHSISIDIIDMDPDTYKKRLVTNPRSPCSA